MWGVRTMAFLLGTVLLLGQDKGAQDPPKESPKPQDKEPAKPQDKEKPPEPPPKPPAIGVKLLNDFRKAHGLGEVTEDEALSQACAKHLDYLTRNNADGTKEDPHEQNKKKGGHSPEGVKAAASSIMAFGFETPEKAFEYWSAGFLNRAPLLDPGLGKIGWAFGSKIAIMDVYSGVAGASDFEPVASPADKADKVPVRFAEGGEEPDPLPKGEKSSRVGYPVLVYFPPKANVRDIGWTMKDSSGRKILCFTSTPVSASVKYPLVTDRTICLIAKERLEANSTYTVTVKCRYFDKNFEKTWSFTTK